MVSVPSVPGISAPNPNMPTATLTHFSLKGNTQKWSNIDLLRNTENTPSPQSNGEPMRLWRPSLWTWRTFQWNWRRILRDLWGCDVLESRRASVKRIDIKRGFTNWFPFQNGCSNHIVRPFFILHIWTSPLSSASFIHSHLPGYEATVSFLFTSHNSLFCSKKMTRSGFDTTRPVC